MDSRTRALLEEYDDFMGYDTAECFNCGATLGITDHHLLCHACYQYEALN